ncbi:MAG: lipoprotein-releasing ABC transporter permease subunit [bacterium]|nr:lipoprotein-releasing ABC transporter permease subunit [bacterium]
MSFSEYIAVRYLRGTRGLFSLGTLISIGGVALGVTTLIVVLSVITGFHNDIKRKILGTNAHLMVLRSGGGMENWAEVLQKVKVFPGVEAVTPFVYSQAMVTSKTNVMGVALRGIDPKSIPEVVDLARNLKEGGVGDLNRKREEPPGIIIGQELARILGVIRGDKINLISPLGSLGPFGMIPRMKEFQIVGVFDSGMYEYDSSLILIHIAEAQKFFDMGAKVTGLEARVRKIEEADRIGEQVTQALGYPFYTRDWKEMNRNLFSALRLEKAVMFVILVLIILVASFNIIANLTMLVTEKGKEIGILKAMGASARGIMRIFLFEGFIIGLSGTMLGLGGGLGLCWILKHYQIIKLPADVYYITTFPVETHFGEVLLVCGTALFISLVATLYPSLKAARKDPVEAIRYE